MALAAASRVSEACAAPHVCRGDSRTHRPSPSSPPRRCSCCSCFCTVQGSTSCHACMHATHHNPLAARAQGTALARMSSAKPILRSSGVSRSVSGDKGGSRGGWHLGSSRACTRACMRACERVSTHHTPAHPSPSACMGGPAPTHPHQGVLAAAPSPPHALTSRRRTQACNHARAGHRHARAGGGQPHGHHQEVRVCWGSYGGGCGVVCGCEGALCARTGCVRSLQDIAFNVLTPFIPSPHAQSPTAPRPPRRRVYFDLTMGNEPAGRITMGLVSVLWLACMGGYDCAPCPTVACVLRSWPPS